MGTTTVTKAGEALRWAVDPTNPKRVSQSQLARDLGVSQPSVSEWVRMRSRPESHLRKAIELLLGIPEIDWMTEAELGVVERAAIEAAGRATAAPIPLPESGPDVTATDEPEAAVG